MSTRIVSIVVLVILVALVIVPAVAEEYCIAAVVVSCETSFFGDVEIEVVDAEGEVWAYYADEARIGDLVILTIFESFEDDEIVDVVTVGRLSNNEIVQWLTH